MAIGHIADNIRVNCIVPGLMWTPRLESSSEMCQTSTSLSAEGQGWDIGCAVLHLASDETRFCTSLTLPVDGAPKTVRRSVCKMAQMYQAMSQTV